MTLDYSGVNSSKAGIYSYNVTCNNGVCDPTTETGNVTVVEACEATAPDFSICEGTTVNEDLFRPGSQLLRGLQHDSGLQWGKQL